MTKKAFIIGITGQDGSYLAELLLDKGYEVHGLLRRASTFPTSRVEYLCIDDHANKKDRLHLHYGDLTDGSRLMELMVKIAPDEVYNLGAQSHVRVSFDLPVYSVNVDALGALNALEAVRVAIKTLNKEIRFYQASSSEMYGRVLDVPQKENTPFYPRSPYGCAKVYAHHQTVNYRESYGMHASNGILFNHESPRRLETFVTRKITRAATRIKLGMQDKLYLGNLDAQRDWGYAKEYCFNLDVPILTINGWKLYNEVNIGDKIINFNTRLNKLEEDVVNKKFKLKSNGDKVLLTGRGVNLNVTKEHRIIYQTKSKKSKGGWSDYKELPAIDFYNAFKDMSVRSRYDFRLPHFHGLDKKDNLTYSDEQLYVIGALMAEGCLSDNLVGRGSVVSLSQSYIKNYETHKKISRCIGKLGLTARIRNTNSGVTEWIFDSESSAKIMKLYDTNDLHVMPKEFYNLSSRQANIVFEAMMDCDGSWGSLSYSSSRYLLSCDFQTIAHIAGYRTTGIKFIKNQRRGVYVVGVITKRKKHAYIQNVKLQNDGHKEVWCVNTNNGTVITRDNDTVNISGNCEAMWLMLQQDKPDDYVIATGETHTVREFLEETFSYLGLRWQDYVVYDEKYIRPAEVDLLIGDATKAKKKLGWEPKTKFHELVKIMVDSDMKLAVYEQKNGTNTHAAQFIEEALTR